VQPPSCPSRWRRVPLKFQSSPVPEDGCNPSPPTASQSGYQFHSSPVPEDGCNQSLRLPEDHTDIVSILTRPGGRVQLYSLNIEHRCKRFQSSPVPEDGCNDNAKKVKQAGLWVSILTRPGGRVQRFRSGLCQFLSSVSILTRPGGRVQRAVGRERPEHVCVSILTRPGGRVQPEWQASQRGSRSFNPHPSRRTGATGFLG